MFSFEKKKNSELSLLNVCTNLERNVGVIQEVSTRNMRYINVLILVLSAFVFVIGHGGGVSSANRVWLF